MSHLYRIIIIFNTAAILLGLPLTARATPSQTLPHTTNTYTSLNISSDRLATQAVPFHNAKGEDIRLNLTDENAPKEVIIGIAYDGWLNNVDFAKMNESVGAKTVMHNTLQSLHYHTGHVHGKANQHHSDH